jgi:SH3-like domain-containing protein
MRQQDGKFILFDVTEFRSWLETASFTRVVKLLQVHHTFQPNYVDFYRISDHFAMLKSMERFHMVDRGFSEIAQNVTTFPDGLVAICRPIDNIPAGIKGANQHGICVENLGNFDANQDAMTPEHRDCIVKVFAHLCRRFNLAPNSDTIQYHHWWDLNTGTRTNGTGVTKTCPGSDFFSGNSLTSAETYFIPRVSQELAAIGTGMAVAQPQPSYSAEVAADSLNVRMLPSLSAKVLKQLNHGVEVRVYENRNGWSRIDPVSSCWVNSQFLRATTDAAQAPPIYSAQVIADLLNVRALPSSTAEVINQLERGTAVYVYEERDGWSRVDGANSLWVCSSYLAQARSAKV